MYVALKLLLQQINMKIERTGIGIISDNDESYLSLLEGVISSVDEYCTMFISRAPCSLNFRIIPSEGVYLNLIVEEVLKLNSMVGIKVKMSKSMKSSGIFEFQIKNINI